MKTNTVRSLKWSKWIQTVLALVVITSILAGCQFPWQKTLEESSTAGEEGETLIVSEPPKDLPPTLVEAQPLAGSVIGLEQSITLIFNQQMDTKSVEAAIRFDPAIDGGFAWEDQQTLVFTPDQPLAPDSKLTITIETTAQAENKIALQEPVEVAYRTSDSLKVLQVLPEADSEDVDPESAVFVTFNQPVVELGAEADGAPAFMLSPDVRGEGQWLNTSTYIFYPEPSMQGGRIYSVFLNDSLVGVSGAAWDEEQDSTYQFTTTQPEVLRILPLTDELLRLDGPVTVEFNVRMDPESVEEHFSLTDPDGVAAAGWFEWAEDLKSVEFYPEELLARDTVYMVEVGGATQSFGDLPIVAPVEAEWLTYPTFNLSTTEEPEFEMYNHYYGAFQIPFSTPLDPETVEDYIHLSPEIINPHFNLWNNDTKIVISGNFDYETDYTVTIDSNLEDIFGGRIDGAHRLTFSTPAAYPEISIAAGLYERQLFIPLDSSELTLQVLNTEEIRLDIYPIDLATYSEAHSSWNFDSYKEYKTGPVEELTFFPTLERNKSSILTFPLTYEDKPLTSGLYLMEVSGYRGQGSTVFLIVSQNHLLMKTSQNQIYVWATRLSDYAPLANKPIEVYNGDGDLITSGMTDANGFFIEDIEEDQSVHYAVIGEPGDDYFSFTTPNWSWNYSYFQNGIDYEPEPDELDAYIYTDRPIYHPGDTVHFKAVVFGRDNGLPVDSGLEEVTAELNLSRSHVDLFHEDLTLNAYGTISGDALIPEDAESGDYIISLGSDGHTIGHLRVTVENYQKPEIDVSISFNSEEILAGEALSANIQAEYYFGLPVSGQAFEWRLYQQAGGVSLTGFEVGSYIPSWLQTSVIQDTEFGDLISSGEGQTDSQGNADLTFEPADLGLDNISEGSPVWYTLEVVITDDSGVPVGYRDTILVHPAEYYIGVQPEIKYGVAETPFNFLIKTVDWDQQPLANQPLMVTYETIEWQVEETGDPYQPYEYVLESEFIASASPVSDEDGLARVSFTPSELGLYHLTVQSGDAVTEVVNWVYGPSSSQWPVLHANEIELIPDAESYRVGQTAQIFLPNPFTEGAKALVTVERGDVMETQVVDVTGSGSTVSIELGEDSIPNVYVSVALLGKSESGSPDYRQGLINLIVEPVEKTLQVELALDPNLAEPGETVTATLFVSDSDGNPVQGEFSVAVVDKAVLALVDSNSLSILDYVYNNVPLSVRTTYPLKTFSTVLNLQAEISDFGGGWETETVTNPRDDFPDTAFWQAEVVTGADGTAKVTIPMPDTLTTWVVDVRGLTVDYQVGQGEGEVVVQKDLMIIPATPRFLVAGDEVELSAGVYNNTSQDREIQVSLQSTGFYLLSESDQTQTVSVSANDSVRVSWWGVVDEVDTVGLIFQAESGSLSDASQPNLGDIKVLRYLVPNIYGTSGQLSEAGQRLEGISFPLSTHPTAGSLTINLIPSLAGILLEDQGVNRSGIYDSTVLTSSRLLSNLNTWSTINDLGLDEASVQRGLEMLIQQDIYRLLDGQNSRGGWTYYIGPRTRPSNFLPDSEITGIALLSLEEAVEKGFISDLELLDESKQYLLDQIRVHSLTDSPLGLDLLTIQVYALRHTDYDIVSKTKGLYVLRSELSPWAKALLALSIYDLDGDQDHVAALLADLEGNAIRSVSGAHWESENETWVLPNTPIFNTAVCTYALAKLDPASTTLPMAVRYLTSHRELWSSGVESAWAEMAISAALIGTGDYQADYSYSASLNDIRIAQGEASGANPLNSVSATTAVDELLADEPNALVIERGEGAGTLYYQVALQTYQLASDAPAINKGINISRAYYLSGEGCPGELDCETIDSFTLSSDNPGQLITVAVTLVVPNDVYNLIVEDYIPAGSEILNQKFETSVKSDEGETLVSDWRRPFTSGWGLWYFDELQIYDDHVAWSADYLPAGTYTLLYEILPYQRGIFQVLPAHAWLYFYPEIQGASAGDVFTIE